MVDGTIRRLRYRALCALHLYGLDRRLPGHPCRSRASGAEEPARDDHRALRHDPEKWKPVFGKDHDQKIRRGDMGRMRKLLIPGVDKKLLVKDAMKVMPDPMRRRFISGGASFGALTMLTGCNVVDSDSADRLLGQISKFNDAVQAWMFNSDALAPEYPESMITKPFPFNAYYDLD